MAEAISKFFGGAQGLNFYDAAAPLVSFESLDMEHCWFASRYDKGTADYINCAMDKEQYQSFVRELAGAEEAAVHGFEDKKVFEGCMPVEVMARRGEDTLRYGPLKPWGSRIPKPGRSPMRWCSSGRTTVPVLFIILWDFRPISAGRSRSGCFP